MVNFTLSTHPYYVSCIVDRVVFNGIANNAMGQRITLRKGEWFFCARANESGIIIVWDKYRLISFTKLIPPFGSFKIIDRASAKMWQNQVEEYNKNNHAVSNILL